MLVEASGIYERLRSAELDALEATQRWADAEVLTLPAKEYYQERRLKSLGLDTEWDETEGEPVDRLEGRGVVNVFVCALLSLVAFPGGHRTRFVPSL